MNNYAVYLHDDKSKVDVMCLHYFDTMIEAAQYYDKLVSSSRSLGVHAVLRLVGYANNFEDKYTITANEV